MRRPWRAVAVALGLMVASAGDAAAQFTREQALSALTDRDKPEHRRVGAGQLSRIGRMEDAPALVRALRDPDGLVRAFAEEALWAIWGRSGDAEVDRLFAIGVQQMSAREVQDAIATFTRMIERRPEFAEGWNKRATVYYLMGEYTKSLADCDEVMKRNPYHFGALSGYGMIHTQLGNPARALEYFERALAINPNLDGVREAAESLRQLLRERRRNTI